MRRFIQLAAAAVAMLAVVSSPAKEKPRSDTKATPVWTGPAVNLLGTPSGDGKYLSYVDVGTGDLAVRDLEKGQSRRLTSTGGTKQFAYFSAISPESSRVAYAWFNDEGFYDLRVVEVDGRGEPQVLFRNPEVGFVQPCDWSPDGEQILTLFFRKDNISQIALVNATDGAVKVLKSLNWVYPKKMSFSPDGQFIVYDSTVKDDSPARDIFILAADGSQLVSVVEHPANDLFPVWTPDGKAILFASDRGGSMDAWVVPVERAQPLAKPRPIARKLGRFLPLGIAKDGKYYFGLRTGRVDVHVADIDPAAGIVDGTAEVVSKGLPGPNSSPDWSPDGKQLAYLTRLGPENYGQQGRVVAIQSLETGETQILAPKLAHIETLRWSRVPDRILLEGSDGQGRGGVFQMEVAGGALHPIIRSHDIGFRGVEAEWGVGGESIFYISAADENAWEMRRRMISTGEEEVLFRPEDSARIGNLALSPDGASLAISLRKTGEPQTLEVISLASCSLRRLLTARKGELSGIDWSPDQSHLLVSVGNTLWRVLAGGGNPTKLDLTITEGGVRLSPAGTRIAYAAGSTASEVWVLQDFLREETQLSSK